MTPQIQNTGTLLLLRVFDGKLITGVYPIPPIDGGSELEQSLSGSLAGLSLRCGSCPPGALTRLSFQIEPLRALVVVLADHTLSVIHIGNESTTVTQVYLMLLIFMILEPSILSKSIIIFIHYYIQLCLYTKSA